MTFLRGDGPTLLCFGYGFSARCLAERQRQQGWRVMASARSEEQRSALNAEGIEGYLFDDPNLIAEIPENAHILISAPPTPEGDPVLGLHREALITAKSQIAWIGYLSTTAVYGDHAGGPVDEDTPVNAGSERGKRRVEAERAWLGLAAEHGLPVHIFRLAGIYGPGRGPFEKVRKGTARRIIKDGQVFGRIHVEDIASTLIASIAKPAAGRVYNVTDDLTCPPQDVIAHAAELLGLPVPPEAPFEEADLSPMARSFYAENKRVSNNRLHAELGVALAYPTYREGLSAILAAEEV